MGKRGRPRKSGKRTASGRLSRAGREPSIIRGNERAEARKALYGSEGGDCLGRAFVMGLLGEGDEAKDRLDKGRKFARIYGRVYRKPYRCALNDNPRGNDNHDESDHQKAEEEWLKDNIAQMDTARRPYMDQLVIPMSPLDDPYWLRGLLETAHTNRLRALGKQKGIPMHPADEMVLREALRGLDEIQLNPPRRERDRLDVVERIVSKRG